MVVRVETTDIQELRSLETRIAENFQKILTVVGERVLDLAREDYETKMHGGTGQDGVQWKPVTEGAIQKRAQRRSSWQTLGSTKRKLSREERSLMKDIRRTLPAGPAHQGTRKAIIAKFLDGNGEYEAIRAERDALRQEYLSLVGAQDTGLIGFDFGEQHSSLTKGYSGNVFEVTPDSVTVGVNQEYSEAFDELRSIFPDDLPESWLADVEELIQQELQRI